MEKDERNLLAAKILRARLEGDKKSAASFEKEFDKLSKKSQKKRTTVAPGEVEVIAPMDENGNILSSLIKSGIPRTNSDEHATDPSIADMQRAIYTHRDRSIDDVLATSIMKSDNLYNPLGSSSTGIDEEDDIYIKPAKEISDKKKQEQEMKEAVRAHQKWENIISNCFYCYGSDAMPKDNLIALGNHTYLTMCTKMRLNEWHVQICPLQHVWSQTECDEDVINEIIRFEQVLIKMAKSLNKGCIFFEEVHLPRGRQHCVVECVMVEREVEMDAPMYFRKAMMECDDVWQAENRKCMNTSEKGIQRSIPKGIPYMFVQWSENTNSAGSMAHVIDDENVFKRNFAQDVLAGMMGLPTSLMLRNSSEDIFSVIKSFLKVWRKFDWTYELDD